MLMNKPIFVWVKNIQFGAHLPTANCEFISSNSVVNAIMTAETARNCQFTHGLAQMVIAHDYQGNTVVCAIKPVHIQCTEVQFIKMVNFSHNKNEGLVGRFLKLLSFVSVKELLPFVVFILNNEEVLKLFMRSEASFKHHHCYLGGLFEHSIEVAEMTYQNAKHLGHSDIECQTGLVAALFHDIGKIYPALNMNNEKYCSGPHESYSFALLAKPLGELGSRNSRIFSMLTELLAGKPYGHKTRYPIEHVLKQADRSSAESNYSKIQFDALPSHYYFTKVNGNVMYRLNSAS